MVLEISRGLGFNLDNDFDLDLGGLSDTVSHHFLGGSHQLKVEYEEEKKTLHFILRFSVFYKHIII